MKRHDWAYLRLDARPAFAAADEAALAFARDWLARGHPFVVARQPEQGGQLALGLALPVEFATRRVACTVEHADVFRTRNPLTVDETAEALGMSPRTVKREWRVARAWLHREVKK